MSQAGVRAPIVRSALEAAATGDEAPVERAYTDDVTGWSPTGVLDLDELRLDPTGRRVELRGVLIAEFEGDRIKRFRQYWDEVALLEGLGLLPED